MFQPFNAKPVPSDIFKENLLKNEKKDVPGICPKSDVKSGAKAIEIRANLIGTN